MNAHEIANAFNGANELKAWSARPNSRPEAELVHFHSGSQLVTIVLDGMTGKFEVRFNKFHAAWGDYVRAIANSMHYILTTLKAGGLPFECPDDPEGIEIIATASSTGATYVRYEPPVHPLMPELANQLIRPLFAPYTSFDPMDGEEAHVTMLGYPDDVEKI